MTLSSCLAHRVHRFLSMFSPTITRLAGYKSDGLPHTRMPCVVLFIVFMLTYVFVVPAADSAGPRKKSEHSCTRYSILKGVPAKPFRFAGSEIPVDRKDVRLRIRFQLNFLLLDARSVLTEWLVRKQRYSWIFDDIFTEENIPKDFILLAPVLSGLDVRYSSRNDGTGCWALSQPCRKADGVAMSTDSWRDDRYDIESSTKCFAARIKKLRGQIPGNGWIMAAAAYVSSEAEVKKRIESWKTNTFWDLPLPNKAEDLVCRWIALGIIHSDPRAFGLDVAKTPPLTFDQVSGLVLSKDLPVAEIAEGTGVGSLKILELNPKIKVAKGMIPAKNRKGRISHKLAVPKGKGWDLVNHLKRGGYLAQAGKK